MVVGGRKSFFDADLLGFRLRFLGQKILEQELLQRSVVLRRDRRRFGLCFSGSATCTGRGDSGVGSAAVLKLSMSLVGMDGLNRNAIDSLSPFMSSTRLSGRKCPGGYET